MIQLPERSVTRFFIPLIDVLLLLFCIFLLLPVAQGTDSKGEPGADLALVREQARQAKWDLQRLKDNAADESRRLAELRKEKTNLLHERLAIKVLEIEPSTGKLYARDERGQRVDIENAKEAATLQQRQKQEVGGRELYYLFLLPRVDSGFPTQGQSEEYERWFAAVPHGWDNPRRGQ
jgi:hypothetical protein